MPALAERTKIIAGDIYIPTTTGVILYGGGYDPYGHRPEVAIDANVFLMTSGSTKIQVQRYLPELSAKAKEILRKVYQFQLLGYNWDGNGAAVPEDQVINNAVNFLSLADEYDLPIYFTAPGPNGEIVLEYTAGSNTAEIFFENGDVSEMILYRGKEQVYSGEVMLEGLIEHLKRNWTANAERDC